MLHITTQVRIMLKLLGYSVDDGILRAIEHHDSLLSLNRAIDYGKAKAEKSKEHDRCAMLDEEGGIVRLCSSPSKLGRASASSCSKGRASVRVEESKKSG